MIPTIFSVPVSFSVRPSVADWPLRKQPVHQRISPDQAFEKTVSAADDVTLKIGKPARTAVIAPPCPASFSSAPALRSAIFHPSSYVPKSRMFLYRHPFQAYSFLRPMRRQLWNLIPDRKKQRQLVLSEKVDAYFAWVKLKYTQVTRNSTIGKALAYSIHQEDYLRVFLSDGNIPMDNNYAEQAIRPFTIGRKNFVLIESSRGANASAILYSLV